MGRLSVEPEGIGINPVLFGEVLVFHPCAAKGFMGVAVVVVLVDDAAGNVGAVVADALQGCQKIGPDKARLDGAVALLQP